MAQSAAPDNEETRSNVREREKQERERMSRKETLSHRRNHGQRDVQRVVLSTEDVYEPVTHKVGDKRVN